MWLAFALMLLASFANFLVFQNYPLARAEVVMLAAGLVLLAALLAAPAGPAGRRGTALLAALLAFLAVDINADRLWLSGVAALAAGAAAWTKPAETMRFLAIVFAVMLATGLLGLAGRDPAVEETAGAAGPPAAGRPLVVEIILDAQTGPAGLRSSRAAGEPAEWLERRYAGMGFAIYPQAYSRHYHTTNALAELASGRPSPGAREGAAAPGLAARLDQLGYGSRTILQSRHFDLCAELRASRCTTYSHASLKVLDRQPLAAAEKAEVLLYHFAGLSTAARKIANAHDRRAGRLGTEPIELRAARKMPQLNALAAARGFEGDLRRARAGDYVLMHLLLPHAPFALDERCQLRPTDEWRIERSSDPLAERDSAFDAQMRCAARVVEGLVEAVRASAGGREAVILVHGDHGSRIVAAEPFGETAVRASGEDLARGFSALFAVSLPGEAARTVEGQAAVSQLVDSLAASGFAGLPEPRPGEADWVYVDNEQKRPRTSRALPRWESPIARVSHPAQL